MTTTSNTGYVLLAGCNLAVPIAPVLLFLDLETRGLTCRRDGDDLVVGPRARLTDDDRRAIRRWKSHLLALIAYEAPVL